MDDAPTAFWWFGFDCAHAGDFMPGLPPMTELKAALEKMLPPAMRAAFNATGKYRDIAYVKQQCERLADQLAHWPGYAPSDHVASTLQVPFRKP